MQEYANTFDFPYIETSAKTGVGVEEAFAKMTETIFNSHYDVKLDVGVPTGANNIKRAR